MTDQSPLPEGHRLYPDIDPRFVFDFTRFDDPDEETQRWSTWWEVDPLCRGPEPRPAWVITDRGAVDTELGILKTGKEAEVYMLERGIPGGPSVTMAAKRYLDADQRNFQRAHVYTEGRSTRRSRDQRAINRKSTWGRVVAATEWAVAEWDTLKRLWSWGVPVPYPVQIDGTEIVMELITASDGLPAPRLVQARPERSLLTSYFEQTRLAMSIMAEHGLVHGDLSAYNMLAAGERIVIIDVPQAVDLLANPAGLDFLMRDCVNVCHWFAARGLPVDENALYGDLVSRAL
ncbi:MAG: serine protein kinase RIO [Nocardioides sp.]